MGLLSCLESAEGSQWRIIVIRGAVEFGSFFGAAAELVRISQFWAHTARLVPHFLQSLWKAWDTPVYTTHGPHMWHCPQSSLAVCSWGGLLLPRSADGVWLFSLEMGMMPVFRVSIRLRGI